MFIEIEDGNKEMQYVKCTECGKMANFYILTGRETRTAMTDFRTDEEGFDFLCHFCSHKFNSYYGTRIPIDGTLVYGDEKFLEMLL